MSALALAVARRRVHTDLLDLEAPDCKKEQTNDVAKAYCEGAPPDSAQIATIQRAVDRMKAISTTCGKLGDALLKIIKAEKFRIFVFDPEKHWFSGGAAPGGDWAILADVWFNEWEIKLTSDGRNLTSAIAHEMDHHLNNKSSNTDEKGHLIENGTLIRAHTLNSKECAGPSSSEGPQ